MRINNRLRVIHRISSFLVERHKTGEGILIPYSHLSCSTLGFLMVRYVLPVPKIDNFTVCEKQKEYFRHAVIISTLF